MVHLTTRRWVQVGAVSNLIKRFVVLSATLLLLAACSRTVVVSGTVPTPLVAQLPVRLGVYYSDSFKTYSYEESLKNEGNWTIDFGQQNVLFFRQLFATLFREVVELDASQLSLEAVQGLDLDAVLIPEIEEYGFLTPGISGLNFYSASVKYKIGLLNREAVSVGEWRVVGYGKSEGGSFQGGQAVNSATLLAIRDGGARIAINFPRLDFVRGYFATIDREELSGLIRD
jgi:hypothetical protein